MIKYLIRKTKDNKFVDMQTVNEEYIHEYQEIEELEQKEKHYIQTYYDSEENTIKQRYVEIPKSEFEILKEKQEKTEQALQDLLLMSAGGM